MGKTSIENGQGVPACPAAARTIMFFIENDSFVCFVKCFNSTRNLIAVDHTKLTIQDGVEDNYMWEALRRISSCRDQICRVAGWACWSLHYESSSHVRS